MKKCTVFLFLVLASIAVDFPAAHADVWRDPNVTVSQTAEEVTTTDVHVLITHFLRNGYGDIRPADFERLHPYFTVENFPVDIVALLSHECFQIDPQSMDVCYRQFGLHKNFRTILESQRFKDTLQYTYSFPMSAHSWMIEKVRQVPKPKDVQPLKVREKDVGVAQSNMMWSACLQTKKHRECFRANAQRLLVLRRKKS